MLIKNVLTDDQVDKILLNFKKLPKEQLLNLGGMLIYPRSFALLDNKLNSSDKNQESYFKECAKYRSTFPSTFGVDLEKIQRNVLSAMSKGIDLEIPKGNNAKGVHPFSNFRSLVPDKKIINVHCGNYFRYRFPNFHQSLDNIVKANNQLSFFILLQAPDRGGELTLYDLEWNNCQEIVEGDNSLLDKQNNVHNLENKQKVNRRYIKPGKGDMIIFAGGEIWHRVEVVKGKTNRITYGAFLNYSKDKNKIYYWA